MTHRHDNRPIVPGCATPSVMPGHDAPPRTGYEAERALFDALSREKRPTLRRRVGAWFGR